MLAIKNSKMVVETVKKCLIEQKISYKEAGMLLNMNPMKINAYE